MKVTVKIRKKRVAKFNELWTDKKGNKFYLNESHEILNLVCSIQKV